MSQSVSSEQDLTSLASRIDHTLLNSFATEADYRQLCQQARELHFWSVCLPPNWVTLAVQELQGSPIKICTVISFPTGCHTMKTKLGETDEALASGADECDLVAPLWAIRSGRWSELEHQVKQVKDLCGPRLLKVIIEAQLLSAQEQTLATQVIADAGADFVKTSTGFAGGARLEDVERLVASCKGQLKVKASGGIRDLESLRKMLAAGASRIGTSSGVAILRGLTSTGGY